MDLSDGILWCWRYAELPNVFFVKGDVARTRFGTGP
jgi:hypothetical protein